MLPHDIQYTQYIDPIAESKKLKETTFSVLEAQLGSMVPYTSQQLS
jgi:hypothetical protein